MSSIKEYMHELWSQINVEVDFLCPICGHPASAKLNISGDEEEHAEEVSCLNDEDEHAWTVIIRKEDYGYSAKLADNSDVYVSIGFDDRHEDWDEPEPEPGAYGIFLDAMREWRYNVTEIGEPDGHSSRNRMLFGTLYSIAEAYFSDTIIGSALADETIQRKLLKLEELGLKDKQLNLDTILDKPMIVRDMIRAALQRISFHKLTMVNQISATAFGKPILPRDADDRAIAVSSVQKRHDCVHRNGSDTEGNKHKDITPNYLRKMGQIFEEMAKSLENAMRDAHAKRFFKDLDMD